MSKLDKARLADAAGNLPLAATLYESVIATGHAAQDVYLDLAILYFTCCDNGVAESWKFDFQFTSFAWDRATKLLDEVEARFDADAETTFWRGYIGFIFLGEPADEPLWRSLLPRSAIASIYPFDDTTKTSEIRANLAEKIKDPRTARLRYVKSVLDFHLRRASQASQGQ